MTISPCVSDRVFVTSVKCHGQHGVIVEVRYPCFLVLIENQILGLLYQNQFDVLNN